MAEERDVVDIDDAADKSEAESSIKWTYHCDSENSTSHIRALRPPCLALHR